MNVRAGAHYTQFMVWDLDGDGRAEVAMKTGDGTVDGTGRVIGEAGADHRDWASGMVTKGPEYLTVFAGDTGAALVTTEFSPARGRMIDWGDEKGNRVDRFLAGVAYLDGRLAPPSLIMTRGYYAKTALAAFDFRRGGGGGDGHPPTLTSRWLFDSDKQANRTMWVGQGNHQLNVADVDGDGRDEVVFGAMVVDHDGRGLYSTLWGHGDALHTTDVDQAHPRGGGEHDEGRAVPAGRPAERLAGEVVWRTEDSSALRIYTTTDPTRHRLVTLLHDHNYRLAVAGQNVAYNQMPHPSFFLGEGMAMTRETGLQRLIYGQMACKEGEPLNTYSPPQRAHLHNRTHDWASSWCVCRVVWCRVVCRVRSLRVCTGSGRGTCATGRRAWRSWSMRPCSRPGR